MIKWLFFFLRYKSFLSQSMDERDESAKNKWRIMRGRREEYTWITSRIERRWTESGRQRWLQRRAKKLEEGRWKKRNRKIKWVWPVSHVGESVRARASIQKTSPTYICVNKFFLPVECKVKDFRLADSPMHHTVIDLLKFIGYPFATRLAYPWLKWQSIVDRVVIYNITDNLYCLLFCRLNVSFYT